MGRTSRSSNCWITASTPPIDASETCVGGDLSIEDEFEFDAALAPCFRRFWDGSPLARRRFVLDDTACCSLSTGAFFSWSRSRSRLGEPGILFGGELPEPDLAHAPTMLLFKPFDDGLGCCGGSSNERSGSSSSESAPASCCMVSRTLSILSSSSFLGLRFKLEFEPLIVS